MAELTTNSVVHVAGSDTLRIGAESDRIVCEVHDSGQLNDPLATRRPSPPMQPGGRGFLLVHPRVDLVRVHTGPDGTALRRYLAGWPRQCGVPRSLAHVFRVRRCVFAD
ncbi:ATP-binding protein, partial [Streptomyces griseoluteus]|uniref:ATP-binding protein n=1 Tax=Streptomyces griseoluteus TaxID=29306 RepID=UPI003693070D